VTHADGRYDCELLAVLSNGLCDATGQVLSTAPLCGEWTTNKAIGDYTVGVRSMGTTNLDTNEICRVTLAGTNAMQVTKFLGSSESMGQQVWGIGAFLKARVVKALTNYTASGAASGWTNSFGMNVARVIAAGSTNFMGPFLGGQIGATNGWGDSLSNYAAGAIFTATITGMPAGVEIPVVEGGGSSGTILVVMQEGVANLSYDVMGTPGAGLGADFVNSCANVGLIFGILVLGVRTIREMFAADFSRDVVFSTVVAGESAPVLGSLVIVGMQVSFVLVVAAVGAGVLAAYGVTGSGVQSVIDRGVAMLPTMPSNMWGTTTAWVVKLILVWLPLSMLVRLAAAIALTKVLFFAIAFGWRKVAAIVGTTL